MDESSPTIAASPAGGGRRPFAPSWAASLRAAAAGLAAFAGRGARWRTRRAPHPARGRPDIAEPPPRAAGRGRGDRALLEALGVAVYTTDSEGRLTAYNEAAVALWGWRPPLGDARWCGSWRLYWPDGRPMPHEQCPMAVALREGRPVRGAEAVAERPDGTRVPFIPYPTPLRDESGALVGMVNVLVDISGCKAAEAALRENEALLQKVFEIAPECIRIVGADGTTLHMNGAGLRLAEAERPEEVVGRCVFDLIAPEHRAEWIENHRRVCAGEALSWEFDLIGLRGTRRRMETHAAPLRLPPEGLPAHLAITLDVTERKAAEERQALLAREVDHRAKNALAVVQSMVRLTRAQDPLGFSAALEGRVAALAHAHTLLSQGGWAGVELRALAEAQLAAGLAAGQVVLLGGPPVRLAPAAVQGAAMVLHELAANAAEHGALSAPGGRVELAWATEAPGGGLRIAWTETGGPPIPDAPAYRGFGTRLIEATVCGQLGGEVHRHWEPNGLRCTLTVAAEHLLPPGPVAAARRPGPEPGLAARLDGRLVLLVEDEPLVAMEMEARLRGLGCAVLGPVATVEEALRLVSSAAARLDAAVLDVNLRGRASFPAADALAARGVPVVFATGYGDLPDGRSAGGGRNILLRKPVAAGDLRKALQSLLARDDARTADAWRGAVRDAGGRRPGTPRDTDEITAAET